MLSYWLLADRWAVSESVLVWWGVLKWGRVMVRACQDDVKSALVYSVMLLLQLWSRSCRNIALSRCCCVGVAWTYAPSLPSWKPPFHSPLMTLTLSACCLQGCLTLSALRTSRPTWPGRRGWGRSRGRRMMRMGVRQRASSMLSIPHVLDWRLLNSLTNMVISASALNYYFICFNIVALHRTFTCWSSTFVINI